jgi:hypothetical protein
VPAPAFECHRRALLQEAHSNKNVYPFNEQRVLREVVHRMPVKESAKGHTIIMDNASFHRKGKLESLAEKAGVALLFLPAYFPCYAQYHPKISLRIY